jgi:class 3 adenylate cyclase
VIEEFGGEEIDSAGDGFFIVFADAGQAVLAAAELQRRLHDLEVRPGEPIGVRMGIHVGEAIRRGREVVGREVNLAARIGASAVPGEVLVSQELRDELVDSARFTFGAARSASLKGFSDDHVVYPVAWQVDPVLAD